MVSYIYSSPNSSNSINHGHQEVPVRFTTFLRLFKLKETFLDAQIGPLVHEAKVRKWLNFHKISVRPPWSIFIITQKPKIIFTSSLKRPTIIGHAKEDALWHAKRHRN